MIDNVKPWESIDFQLLLKPPKNPEKSTSYSIIHKETMNPHILFLELPLPKESKDSYISYSLDDFIKLKETNKKFFKKIIKKYNLVVPSGLAAKVLKSFGKIFQRYNKTPILSSGIVDPNTIEKRQYYRLTSHRIQGKLGSAKDSENSLNDRLNLIAESLILKGYSIVKKMVKTTQGKPIIL